MKNLLPPLRIGCLLLAAASSPSQQRAVPDKDPFTGGQAKAMQGLGVVAYGPLPWADGRRTTDVDTVLGENRILWLETAHFRIGSTLQTCEWPIDTDARRELTAELGRLTKLSSKVPKKPKKFEPWLRLHLFAQRAEELYGEMAELANSKDGATPAGPFLGLPDKYLLLLLEKKSDLARYVDRFCERQADLSLRHFHPKSRQQAVMIAAEADPPHDEAAVHAQMRYLLVNAMVDGLDGRIASTPDWLRLGLAHWFERQVTTQLINCAMHDDEHVDGESQHRWSEKMRARALHDDLLMPFDKLTALSDFGYYANLEAWSRVDYLMQLERGKVGGYLMAIKTDPSPARQEQVLQQLFGFDGATFDKQWRDWIQKNYR